jgi:hypothetical protein
MTPAGPWVSRLTGDFPDFAVRLPGRVGIAVLVTGSQPTVLGEAAPLTAWSTSKVPLVLAAVRAGEPAGSARVRAALSVSDNAAAEELWTFLGGGQQAAKAVETVLRDHRDDQTQVQARRVRRRYTAFGQTPWSVDQQVVFLDALATSREGGLVLPILDEVMPAQRWGFGRLAGARVKGGWGPERPRGYLVRQMALLPAETGHVAVAVTVIPDRGSFRAGVSLLDTVAGWVCERLADPGPVTGR